MKPRGISEMEHTIYFEYEGGKEFSLNHKSDYPFIRSLCTRNLTDDIKEFIKSLPYKNIVQVGIGGSALGATAAVEFMGGIYHNYTSKKRYFAMDNIDPERIKLVFEYLNPEETLFHIVSKSGSTIETISQFFIIEYFLKEKLGNTALEHVIITTDPDTGFLREFSEKNNIKSFPLAKEAGGRYSVFTPVGLVPMAFLEYNIDRFVSGAKDAIRAYRNGWSMPNEFVDFTIGEYENGRNILVMFSYKDRLYSTCDWFRQLWAESLGKNSKGQTPVKALGATDQHSQLQLYRDGPKDKVIIFVDTINRTDVELIPGKSFEYLEGKTMGELLSIEKQSTKRSLIESNVPCGEIFLKRADEYSLGAIMASLMISTAKAGEVMGVNPFDQPGVELGKKYTKKTLREKR